MIQKSDIPLPCRGIILNTTEKISTQRKNSQYGYLQKVVGKRLSATFSLCKNWLLKSSKVVSLMYLNIVQILVGGYRYNG